MIRTFSARLRARGRSLTGAPARSLASEAGDTLIEVLISALLVGLIVVGTFSGLNSANRSTSIDRARSQADALAEQNEEQLRSEPIKKLDEFQIPKKTTVTEGKTVYTIETSTAYIEDKNATASCSTASSEKAEYLQTTTKVTSPLISGKAVEETGIISPPAGAALIAQVQESGTALQEAKVAAIGPSPSTTTYELETSSKGCAILTVPPGEYNIYVSKPGYVDPNGYENTHSDSATTRSVYIPAETTSKVGYNLGLAGTLAVNFTGSTPAEGDTFVAFNTGMTTPKPFGTVGTYSSTVASSKSIFPFTTDYTVYAGTCEADLPTKNGQSSNPETLVEPGKTANVNVPLAPINIKVLKNVKGKFEETLQNATVRLVDTGCETVHESTTNSTGALSPHPGMPFGNYSLCVTATIGAKPRKDTISIANNNASGTPLQKIYLLEEGEEKAGCP
jgi:Tfp pilus assembly protein PilV